MNSATPASGAEIDEGLIRIADPDRPIHRIFPLWFLEEALRLRQLVLVPPRNWEDPYEIVADVIQVCRWENGRWHQEIINQELPAAYAQCWSETEESDTLLRAYSHVIKDPHFKRNIRPRDEGVRVTTTPRKLIRALIEGTRSAPKGSCFLGAVRYLSEKEVLQTITNAIGHIGNDVFANPSNRAKLLLLKRLAFAHEAELRLLYVRHQKDPSMPLLRVPIKPNELFDQITFDPRLEAFEREEREAVIRSLGYDGEVKESLLYMGALLEVVLNEPTAPKE